MPYAYSNWNMVNRLYNGNWMKVSALRRLLNALRFTDYSVVADRREAHRLLNQAISDMEGPPFGDTTQFPTGFGATYITDADVEIVTLFTELATTLSYRSTNVAKDTDAGKANGAPANASIELLKEQGVQDNTKKFQELLIKMGAIPTTEERLWTRNFFEGRTGAAWT